MARHPPINTSFSRFLSLNILYALHIVLLCTFIFSMSNAPPYNHSYCPSTHDLGVSVKFQISKLGHATYDYVKYGFRGGGLGFRYREMGGEKDNETAKVIREIVRVKDRLEREREARVGC